MLLVIGSSCAVAPANTLPYAAMSHGCHVIEINLESCLHDEVPIDDGDGGRPVMEYGRLSDFSTQRTFLSGTASAVLSELAARVSELNRRDSE